MPKVLVLYYSTHGHVDTMARPLWKVPAVVGRESISSVCPN